MTLNRISWILRTAALASAVLLACVGCSAPRNYGLREVAVAARGPGAGELDRPAVRLPPPRVRARSKGAAPVGLVWSAVVAARTPRPTAVPAPVRPQPFAAVAGPRRGLASPCDGGG